MKNSDESLVIELEKLLKGGTAHIGLNDAVANLPDNLIGRKHEHLPYSIWQLVEHIRIAQWDMLEFSKSAIHESPEWPEGYWPKNPAPKNRAEFDKSMANINADLDSFIELLHNNDLHSPLAHGNGQTILSEALQIADHTAYHIAEIIIIRRLFGAWNNAI